MAPAYLLGPYIAIRKFRHRPSGWYGCVGKKAFVDRYSAIQNIRYIHRRHRRRRMDVYRCRLCHQWHVGGSW